MRNAALRTIHWIGLRMPKRFRRAIADAPGVLSLFQTLTKKADVVAITPEGFELVVSPLFHGQFCTTRGIREYEPKVRSCLAEFVQPGAIAYDIGANVGVFTLQLASLVGPAGRVYAFEPEKNNHQRLLQTIDRNNLSDRIVVDQRAVGPETTTVSFDRRGGAFSGRVVDGTQKYRVSAHIVEVAQVSIDGLIAERALQPPEFVKIDVEGFEYAVLQGMIGTLQSHRPIVLLELHFHLGDDVRRCISLLANAGYSIFTIDGEPFQMEAVSSSTVHVLCRHESAAGDNGS